MTTDQKIREAYFNYTLHTPEELQASYSGFETGFKAGYLALLNSLTYGGYDYGNMYRLPEGVTKP